MTLEEIEATGNWENEDYFQYMRETGNWDVLEGHGVTGTPCDRCGCTVLESCTVETYFLLDDGSSHATEFELCTLCVLQLYAAAPNTMPDEEVTNGTDQRP